MNEVQISSVTRGRETMGFVEVKAAMASGTA